MEVDEKTPVDHTDTYTLGVWYDWTGGDPPVKDWHTLVDIEQRDGRVKTSVTVGAHKWSWSYGEYYYFDIVRFCIVTNEEKQERKEAIAREMGKTPNERITEARGHGGASDDDDDSSSAGSPQRSTAGEDTSRHNDGLPPMKEGLAEKVGCWPGQFNDIDWRKGT